MSPLLPLLGSLRKLIGRKSATRKRPLSIGRLVLEILEDRTLLSTLFVNPSGLTANGSVAYRTIQAAVNAGAAGDSILVDPGTYTENVAIPTSLQGLTLNGAKSGVNPVPGRSGPESVLHGTITITGSGVTVDGFTVTANAQSAIQVGTGLQSGPATNSVIQNNIVTSSVYGIHIGPESSPQVPLNSVVRNNVVQAGPLGAGIRLFQIANCTVQGNAVTGGYVGIAMYFSDNNTVSYNTVNNCVQTAVRVAGAHGNLVEYNTGSGNGEPVIRVEEGSSGNTIQNNFGPVAPPAGPGSSLGLIVNGDFEQGNTGFRTEYRYSRGAIGAQQSYDILPNPRPAHSATTASYGDHTTGSGLMVAVNGSLTPNVLVWGQTVAVTPNTAYQFSAFISSWFSGAPGQLEVLFNGTRIGIMTAPLAAGVWVPFTATWNSGSATSAVIELRNLTTADIGNDFSLDDLALASLVQPTATAISSSVNASVYGQPVTFTATVTSGGSPVNTGTVTFREGNTVLAASVPLDSSGRASFQIASLTAGSSPYTITASYSGATSFAVSSGSLNQTVNQAPLRVTADDKTKVYGQANPIFTASYSGFVLGENQSVLSGTLSLSTPATTSSNVGSYAITPSGLTSGNYAITFVPGTLTVSPAALTVTANSASRVYGQANPGFSGTITGIQNNDPITVTFTTAATPSSNVGSYGIVPILADSSTGKLANYTVTSTNGTLTVTPASLTVVPANVSRPFGTPNPALGGTISGIQNNDNITASFSTTASLTSPVGSYPVTATLSDLGNRLGNYSLTLHRGTLTVTPASTTTTVVSSSANPAVFGQGVTFTASVTVPGGVNPTGTVLFLDGTTTLGSSNLNNGQASFTISTLPVGHRAITAVYQGNANFNPSSSAVLSQSISRGATTVALTPLSRSVNLGQPVTFTIAVNPVAPANGTVTGTVTLRNGSIPLATVGLSNGLASFTTASLPVGRLSITAEASGDANFTGSTSAPVDQIIGSLNQRFVAQLYLDLLGRTADEVGLSGFTQFLDRGGSRQAVAQAILGSAEYRTVVVQALYQQFLKRVADPVGLGAAVTFLSNGGTVAQLKAVLLGSDEYFQTRGLGTHAGFLTAVYQDVLGRNLDANGATTFSQLLARNVSRTAVAALIVGSTEANQVLVSGFYQRFLRRPVDQTGLTAFVPLLQQGIREEDIVAALTGSDEYFNRLR